MKTSKPAPIRKQADAGKGILPLPAAKRPFHKINYIMMAACLALIIIGFLLMTGPGSSAETGFNPDIFSTRRIVVGPTIAFLGFLLMAFAIIWKPKEKKVAGEQSAPCEDVEATLISDVKAEGTQI